MSNTSTLQSGIQSGLENQAKWSQEDWAKLKQLKISAYNKLEAALKQSTPYKDSQALLTNAVNDIQSVLRVLPKDGDSLNLLGRIQLELNHPKKAITSIEQALKISGDNAGYWYSLGHAALRLKKYERSIAAFEKAITIAPKETYAETGLAYALLESGDMVQAFQKYRELIKTNSENNQIRTQLIKCSSTIQADYFDPELEQDLITYLQWHDVNLEPLSKLVSSLLLHKFSVTENSCAAKFDEIAHSDLFKLALTTSTIKSGHLERLIMTIRHELLTHASQSGTLSNTLQPLAFAICHHAIQTEFILPNTEGEAGVVNALKSMVNESLNHESCTPTDILGALVLILMYEPWFKLNNYPVLENFNHESWPDLGEAFIRWHLNISKLSNSSFEKLSEIDHELSVKKQYESFPYPRWENLDQQRPINYGRALELEFGYYPIPSSLYEKDINVLIAGCGTGRHALNVAKYFNNVHVTAIDMSLKSLSYAKQKSESLNIHNIDFYQADLTKLHSNDKHFDIVECSGVLHHIPEYKLALKNILDTLKPNGFLKLSLYSRQARQSIISIRENLSKDVTQLSDDEIKLYRQAILLDDDQQRKTLIESPDFMSMSGIKDLVFHNYEIQFSPLEIKNLCNEFDLKWIGFSGLSAKTLERFHNMFGISADATNLEQWEVFEIEYPNTFTGMYQFYCQYQPKLKVT